MEVFNMSENLISKENFENMLNAFFKREIDSRKKKDHKKHEYSIEGMFNLSVFPVIVDDDIIMVIPAIKNNNSGTMYFCNMNGALDFEMKKGDDKK